MGKYHINESKNLKFFNKKGILNIKNSHELANSVCQKMMSVANQLSR